MRKTLGTLQGGRWLAASAVMFAHALTGVDAFVGPSGDVVRAVANRGYLGVDFFFVLSGFIIFHVHAADPRSLSAVASFAWRRAVRIYVPCLPIVAGLILLYQLLPDVAKALPFLKGFICFRAIGAVRSTVVPVSVLSRRPLCSIQPQVRGPHLISGAKQVIAAASSV